MPSARQPVGRHFLIRPAAGQLRPNHFAMGIRFACPNGHKLNVKEHLAGKRGICPSCGAKFTIPMVALPPATAATGGTRSDEFGPPSGLIRVSEPLTVPNSLEDLPDSVIVGVPTRSITPQTPAPPALPVPTDLDLPLETGSISVPIIESAATPAPSMEELFLPPVGDAPVATVAPEPATPGRRQSGRKLQLLMAIVLLLAVIILAGVLIWVLQRESKEKTADRHNEIRLAQSEPRPYIVVVNAG